MFSIITLHQCIDNEQVESIHRHIHLQLCTACTACTVCTEKLKPLHTSVIFQKGNLIPKDLLCERAKGNSHNDGEPNKISHPYFYNLEYIISLYQSFLNARQVEPTGS